MRNKTLDSRLVASSPGFAADAHHALVVIHERDGGRALHQVVHPGEKFRRPLLVRGTLLPYQVALDDRRRHDFGCRVLHVDGVRTFTLHIELRYRVLPDGAHLPVMRLDADPLGAVEGEIKLIVAAQVRGLAWAVIEQQANLTAFAVDARSVDDNGELHANLERIRSFARGFGIDVRQVAVGRHLDEGDLDNVRRAIELTKDVQVRDDRIRRMRDERREHEARHEVDAELAVARSEIDLVKEERLRTHAIQRVRDEQREAEARYAVAAELALVRDEVDFARQSKLRAHTLQRIQDDQREAEARLVAEHQLETRRAKESAIANAAKILEGYTAGTREAVLRITGDARSIPEIERQLLDAQRLVGVAQAIVSGADDVGGGASFGHGHVTRQLGAASGATAFHGPARNLEDVLTRACEVAAALRTTEREQRQFLAAVLRLQAARLVEAEASEVESHRAEVDRISRVHAQDLPEDHLQFLATLVNARGATR